MSLNGGHLEKSMCNIFEKVNHPQTCTVLGGFNFRLLAMFGR